MTSALPATCTPDRKDRPHQAVLPVYAVTPFTMLDFPGKTACIIWFTGCNMRCPYCHNPQIVKGKGRGDLADVMAFLRKRQGLLDGVVLSGGEASVYPALPDFMRQVRDMGYAVKLDTNGLRPDVVARCLDAGLVDFVALDYKAPPRAFSAVTGTRDFTPFSRTLDLLCAQQEVGFEVRTTVHTALLDEDDIAAIIRDLDARGYRGVYAVQNFTHSDDRPTLGMMGAQARLLDCRRVPRPAGFSLVFRNFPAAAPQ